MHGKKSTTSKLMIILHYLPCKMPQDNTDGSIVLLASNLELDFRLG
nr:MAG TPA: hypothetical protein [Caudoviricetes sp.]